MSEAGVTAPILYIHVDGKQEGPLTLDAVNLGIAQGTLAPGSVMAWYQGCASWVPLLSVPGVQQPATPSPPPPPGPPPFSPPPVSESSHPAAPMSAITENMHLVRLQRFHGEIAGTQPGRIAGCGMLLISGLLGLIVFLLTAGVLQAYNVGEGTWVPVALLAFVSVWAFVALLLQRDARRKASAKQEGLRQQLADAVKEIASASPEWVASVGGPGALVDGRRFGDLLVAFRGVPGSMPLQAPAMAVMVTPQGPIAVPVVAQSLSGAGAEKLRACARGFLVGGVLNIVVGIVLIAVVGPFALLTLALGTIELVHASLFWRTPPSAKSNPTWVAVLELSSLVIGSFWSFIAGIANLTRLRAPDTKAYLDSVRTGLIF